MSAATSARTWNATPRSPKTRSRASRRNSRSSPTMSSRRSTRCSGTKRRNCSRT